MVNFKYEFVRKPIWRGKHRLSERGSVRDGNSHFNQFVTVALYMYTGVAACLSTGSFL
jgi:hypothetical protein